MKTFIASLALAFATLTTSFAGDNTKVSNPEKPAMQTAVYPSKGAQKINVVVGKTVGASAQVKLISEKGDVLVTQQIGKKQTVVHTRFDVSQLSDGVYTVEITSGGTKEVKSLKLSTLEQQPERVIAMK